MLPPTKGFSPSPSDGPARALVVGLFRAEVLRAPGLGPWGRSGGGTVETVETCVRRSTTMRSNRSIALSVFLAPLGPLFGCTTCQHQEYQRACNRHSNQTLFKQESVTYTGQHIPDKAEKKVPCTATRYVRNLNLPAPCVSAATDQWARPKSDGERQPRERVQMVR